MTSRVDELRARIREEIAATETRLVELRAELRDIGGRRSGPRGGGGSGRLTDTRSRVLAFLESGEARPRAVAEGIGLSYNCVAQALSRLARAGLLVRRRHGGDSLYSLVVSE